MTDEEMAHAWDVGYDTAIGILESGLYRIILEGEKALKDIKRPSNPYRLGEKI